MSFLYPIHRSGSFLHRFANRWMGTRNLTMNHDTFAYLYNKVDGQTWYIQDILNRLYQNGKEITTAEIDDSRLWSRSQRNCSRCIRQHHEYRQPIIFASHDF